MKKLLALLLSMIMALSLAVPAFADGPDGPPAPDSLGIIGGQDGPTAVITSGPVDGAFNWWTADDELKESMGGVPGQIGLMVNGTYVKFPDAAPEISSSRTMIPVRALVETLGGEVDYKDRTVKFVLDGYVYEFTIGSPTVTVSPAGDGGGKQPDIKMDCAPYIKGGRTYVPIRFISEALGYEVGWDSELKTAILVDREALAESIDKSFTILNKVQASQALTLKEGESSKADVKGEIDLIIASLEGNKTYSADFDVTGLANADAVSGSASLNISDALVELVMGQLIGGEGAEYEKDAAVVRSVLEALKKFEFIMNKDGMMWVHSDGLDGMAGQKNLWFSGSADMDLSALYAAGMDVSSVGKMVAAMADKDSVANWAMVNQIVKLMGIYSDDKFTTTGGTSTLTIGLDDLMGLYEDMGLSAADMESAKDVFKEYKITMKVDSKGGTTVKCVVETNAMSGVPGIKMTMDAEQSGGKGTVTMDITVASMGQLKLTLTASEKATSEKPMTEPPKGATVIDTNTPMVLPELGGSSAAQ